MTWAAVPGRCRTPSPSRWRAEKLIVLGVISTNRNFEGRLHPSIRGTYLASPPLVVAYSIAGSVLHNVANGVHGTDANGNDVRLRDLWPSEHEVRDGHGHRP